MIKRRNHIEAENQIINQLAAEKCIVYLSIVNQIYVSSLVPILDFFRLALIDYSLIFFAFQNKGILPCKMGNRLQEFFRIVVNHFSQIL